MNIVVTAGQKYIDIDAYAGCIAYVTLLNSIGIEAKAVTTAPLNESIPNIIKNIDLKFDDYIPNDNDKFIILDISNPDRFDKIVKKENIIEVIDHHIGFEDYWQGQKNVKSQIEFIGSIGTIIYEKIILNHQEKILTKDLCKLLTAAILDNTLNLKANITSKRDIKAYNELIKLGNLDDNWSKNYFEACEKAILNNLEEAIINDTKRVENKNLPNVFAQLAIYNSDKVLNQMDLITKIFSKYDEWMFNLIDLDDGISYIITNISKNKLELEKLFNKKFINNILTLDKFMLRKEIIKMASEI